MLTQEQVVEIFMKAGALQKGHFKLTSGLHSAEYIEKFRVLERPELTAVLCKETAERFKNDNITVVVGPVSGGVILSHVTAGFLGVKGIFTERENGSMCLRRGFSIGPGERVLVVEDIVTTGKSVFEVLEAVKPSGAKIAGVAVLMDRSGGKVDFGIRKEALATLQIETHEPDKCPLCAQGIPVVKPGSRNV